MSISFSGLASGLDTTSWIKSLTALKQAKVTSLEKQKSGIQALQSSLGSIKTFFSSFRTSLEKITDTKFNIASMDIFSQCIANTTNARVLTAVASANAKEGNYDIEVKKLATKTKASSRASYTQTIKESSNASENTKLADLGITSGSIMFTFIDGTNSGEITVDENTTLKGFAATLRENGIDAYYSEWSGLFTTDLKDVQNIEQKNPTNVLEKLGITLDGSSTGYYSKKSLQLEEIVNRTADTDTTLAALNVTNGTIKIQNCSDDSTFTIDIDADNFTLGNFIQNLNENGIYASLNDDGVLSISNANIIEVDTTTNLASALGLTRTVASNSAQTGKLTYNVTNSTTVQAKGTTLLSELGGDAKFVGEKSFYVRHQNGDEKLVTINGDFDIEHVVTAIKDMSGLDASYDNDTGKLTISGGEIIGRSTDTDSPLYISDEAFFDINSIFGLSPTGNTAVSSKTLMQVATSTPVTASTKLGNIGISGTQDLIIENANGSQTTLTIDNAENITISTLRSKISGKGISSVLNADGSLTFTNTTKKIVGGSLAEALGITTETYTVEASNQLKYNVVSTATTSSQLQYLGISGTNNITITKADGTELSQDFTQSTYLQSVLDFLNTSDTGVTASFNNGVISITSNGSVIDGALASALGINTEYQTVTGMRFAQTSNVLKKSTKTSSTSTLGSAFGKGNMELNVSLDNIYASVLNAVNMTKGIDSNAYSTNDFYIKQSYANTDAGAYMSKSLNDVGIGNIDDFFYNLNKSLDYDGLSFSDTEEALKQYTREYADANGKNVYDLKINNIYEIASNYIGEKINNGELKEASSLRTTVNVLKILNCTSDITIADLATDLNRQFGISFSINDSTGKISIGSGANIITKQGAINKQLELSKTADCSNPQILDIGETDTLTSLGIGDKPYLTTITIDENGNAIKKTYQLDDFDRKIYEMLREQGANVTIKNGKIRFDGESIIGGSFVQERYGSENYYKYDGYSNLSYNTESVAQHLVATNATSISSYCAGSATNITFSNGEICRISHSSTISGLCDNSYGLLTFDENTGTITLNQDKYNYITNVDTDLLSNMGIDINVVKTSETKVLVNKNLATSSSVLTTLVNGDTTLEELLGETPSTKLSVTIDMAMTSIFYALGKTYNDFFRAGEVEYSNIEEFFSMGYYKRFIEKYDIDALMSSRLPSRPEMFWNTLYSIPELNNAGLTTSDLQTVQNKLSSGYTIRDLYGALVTTIADKAIDNDIDISILKPTMEFEIDTSSMTINDFCTYINENFGLEASFDSTNKRINFERTFNSVTSNNENSNLNKQLNLGQHTNSVFFGTNFQSRITNSTKLSDLVSNGSVPNQFLYTINTVKFNENGEVVGKREYTILLNPRNANATIFDQMRDQGYDPRDYVVGGTLMDALTGPADKYNNPQSTDTSYAERFSESSYSDTFNLCTVSTTHTLGEIGFSGNGGLAIVSNGITTNIEYNENTTLGDFINMINTASSNLVSFNNGILTINASANSYIANDSNNIMQDIFKINPTTSEASSSLVSTVPTVVSGTTKLSDLPNYEYGTWEITNSETGTTSTIRFGSDKTVNEIIGDLRDAGIDAKLSTGSFNLSYAPSITINKNGIDPLSLTKNSTKFVGTSEQLVIYTYQNADVSTKLADLKDENGASFDFSGKTITLTKNDGSSVTKNLSGEQNLNEILNWFSQNGINAYTDSGRILFESNAPFTLSDNSSNQVCDFLFGNISNSTTYNQVNPLEYVKEVTNTVEMTNDTKMSDLGITAGEFYIFNNGVRNVIDVAEDMTIGEFRNILSSFSGGNLYTSLNNGNLVVNGTGNSYIAKSENANATNLVDKLFPDGFSQSYNYTSNALNEDVITYLPPTGSTLISNYDEPNKPSAGILNLKIGTGGSVQYKSIEITADETFDSLTQKFKQIGLDARLVDGVYRLNTDADITQRASTSNLFSNLELDQNPYSNKKVTIQTTRTETVEGSAAESVGMDTKLNVLGITNGKFIIDNRGNAITVDVSADDTFNDLNEKIKTASSDKLSLTIDNGIIKIASSNTNDTLNTRITGASSNIISICGFSPDSNGALVSSRPLYKVNGDTVLTNTGMFRNGTVTTGTFTIGDAELTVSNDTTINDLIRMINQNENTLCTAYWDSTSGQLVLSSRVAGSSMINIEKGTSNITDILGFTVNNTIADNAQELGQNALFTINGTTMTHTSNTITSDISKIDGVTINLNDASDGEIITLSIERDNESIANTLQEVVDSYNDLMNNLDKELALDGNMKDQTTLKMLRNTIRSYMMNSVGFSNAFMNMSSIGISTDSASAGNISTSGISTLSFDKTKFANAIAADPNSVKKLLVGENNGMGILTKLEQTVENALQAQSGFFSATENSYNKQIERLNTKIEKTQRSVDSYSARLERKFQAMDLLISNIQKQYSSFLSA